MSQADAIPLPAVLWRRLPALGIAPLALLRQAGLPANLMAETRPKVSTAGFFALWRALEVLDSDPAFGLRLASEASADQLDVASIAAMHAPTFGAALQKLARYKRLVCPEQVQLQATSRQVSVVFHWWLSRDAPPPRLIDACLASCLVLGRHGTGRDLRPVRVELARPEAHRAMLESYFGCRVRFDEKFDRIVFEPAALELAFRTANPDLLAMLVPGLEAALALEPAGFRDAAFVDRVRETLRLQMQGQRPTVEAVGRALALSARSLQRRLSEVGTSYQRLLDEVRESVACELLGRTELDSGEIAFLLGFEELNSFNRAFTSWKGTTPLRWRRDAQSSASAYQKH
ncbi:MAG TPA: AraC family transcriptional regulator [Rubrivivax sp.]|nr:AraC family transcriptional regulator [Rubrivivax sp.]